MKILATSLVALGLLGAVAPAANAAGVAIRVGHVGVGVGGGYHYHGHYYHHRRWEHRHWHYW